MDDQAGPGRFDERASIVPPWAGPAQALGQAERSRLRADLLAALEALPEVERVVFVLRDLEAWSTEEIAAALGASPAAVLQGLHQARLQLQEALERPASGGAPGQLPNACREGRARLTEWAEGALPSQDRLALDCHLRLCAACLGLGQRLQALPGLARVLLAHGEKPPPPAALTALACALRRLEARRRPNL